MRTSVVLTTLYAVALLGSAISAHAQTTPATATSPPASVTLPAAPAAPPAKPTRPEEVLWEDDGATAQCRDGMYFHGNVSPRTCADHGGVLKWLSGPDRPTLPGKPPTLSD
jgi:uncharacterized iron-regulated membrane protein